MSISESSQRTAEAIAFVLAAEIEQAIDREEFGVLAQDIKPVDTPTLISSIFKGKTLTKQRARMVIVDDPSAVSSITERDSSLSELLSHREEAAVQWRNKHLKTIAVVSSRPLAKAASLREFRTITERELIARFCAAQRDAAPVTWLRTLWNALASAKSLRISLVRTVEFGQGLDALPPTERSAQAPRHLHLLGLLPDSGLADQSSDASVVRRLQANRDLVLSVQRATPEDWNRVRVYIRSLSGKEKSAANKVLRGLRSAAEGGSLAPLDYPDVLRVWRGKPADTKTPKGESSIARIEVEEAVARHLMFDNTQKLEDISEEISMIVQHAMDDVEQSGQQPVAGASNEQTAATVNADHGVLELVRGRSTHEEWGGIIDVASEKPGALTEVSAFKAWTPFSITPVREMLSSFVGEDLAPPTLIEALDQFVALRQKLVPHVAELAVSPIAYLAGKRNLLSDCQLYLELYESILRTLHTCYHEMHGAADTEAELTIARILALETYIYRRGENFEAILSPLHPLVLWRTVTLVNEVRGLGGELAPHEIEAVAEASSENSQFLQVLLIPPFATNKDSILMLGHAGFIGRLPIYRETPRGLLESDGVQSIADYARRIAQLRPYVRAGLQIVLVNAPHPKQFISALLDHLDLENSATDTTFWGLHIRVRYTHEDTRGWSAELDDMDDNLRELISAGEEKALVSISVRDEVMPWDDLTKELADSPAHMTVVVDPFEVRSTQVARGAQLSLSPWMPTCEYRFNKIRKEVQVIPVAEEHVFGHYLATAGLIHSVLQKQIPAHLPQVQKVKDHIDKLAQSSLWTVLADPHRVPVPRVGESETIDRRIDKSRQITCFASDLAPFVRRLDGQLKKTHFVADEKTLLDLARDLVAMEPNGILGLATSSHEKQVKGSLGKIIAVRWYRMQQPSGLAVSLDTDNARRWLAAGRHSNEKADLLGLREDGDTLIIDVLEVKAHDEAAPYSVSDGVISGRAIGQLLATMQALAEVFAPSEASPLARPRREVLREHLYTALLRDRDSTYVERWHTLLADVFDGKVPVKISGRIVHVQLASVSSKATATYLTEEGVPITVETLSAEHVGLTLTANRAIAKETPIDVGSAGVQIDDRLEPSVAFRVLTAPQLARRAPETATHTASDAPNDQQTLTDLSVPNSVDASSDYNTKPSVDRQEPSSGRVNVSVNLGIEHASRATVQWAPGKQSNGFFLVLGASGSGKTESLKVIASPIAQAGIPVLVFDFHGDVKLPGIQSVLLSSGSASTYGLNPMELDISSAEESGLYDQRAALRNMIQRAVPSLGHRQSSILREAFDEAYRAAGILDGDVSTWTRPAPTFRDVQTILETWTQDDGRRTQRAAIEGCIAAVQELFDHPIFQRKTHISIDEMLAGSIRLDLSKLPDQIRFVATETLLRKIFRKLRLLGPIPVQPADDRERFRLFVVIDEAKILSLGGGERDRADNILNELITEARKFGLGMILASQMSEHFSEEVRANAATWLVLKPMDVKEAKKNAPNVQVDPDDLIRLAGRGDGYYRDRPSSSARRIQVNPLSTV